MTGFWFLLFLVVGFIVTDIITHNNSPVKRKLPSLKIYKIEILPNFKIKIQGRVFWIHHWIYFSVLLVFSVMSGVEVLESVYTKGLLIGGILQGISFPDWKRVVIKEKNL